MSGPKKRCASVPRIYILPPHVWAMALNVRCLEAAKELLNAQVQNVHSKRRALLQEKRRRYQHQDGRQEKECIAHIMACVPAPEQSIAAEQFRSQRKRLCERISDESQKLPHHEAEPGAGMPHSSDTVGTSSHETDFAVPKNKAEQSFFLSIAAGGIFLCRTRFDFMGGITK